MPSARKGIMSAREKKDGLLKAAELLKTNKHTIRQCMEASGLSDTSFYKLIKQNAPLAEVWEDAKQQRGILHRESMVIAARVGLYKLLTGHKETLTRTIKDGAGEVISYVEWEVYTPPSANAVMGILRHIDRETIPEESLITVQHEMATINVHHLESGTPPEAAETPYQLVDDNKDS